MKNTTLHVVRSKLLERTFNLLLLLVYTDTLDYLKVLKQQLLKWSFQEIYTDSPPPALSTYCAPFLSCSVLILHYSYSQNILFSYQAPDPATKPSKEELCLDSSLNVSDLSLEITSEPSNESADWTGSSVENSEEIRE